MRSFLPLTTGGALSFASVRSMLVICGQIITLKSGVMRFYTALVIAGHCLGALYDSQSSLTRSARRKTNAFKKNRLIASVAKPSVRRRSLDGASDKNAASLLNIFCFKK